MCYRVIIELIISVNILKLSFDNCPNSSRPHLNTLVVDLNYHALVMDSDSSFVPPTTVVLTSTAKRQGGIFSDSDTILFLWVAIAVLCQIVIFFGMTSNIINIICFVKQGFKDSVNVSLLG